MTDMQIHPIVTQIIGRCHVGQSNHAVLRYFVLQLRHGYRTWREQPRAARREWMQQVFAEHAANRALYRHMMI